MSLPNLTAKQLRFLIVYKETQSASQAYKAAYDCKSMVPQTISANASRMLANSKIALHLEAWKQQFVKKATTTTESVLRELEEARKMAERLEQPSAMALASMYKAKVGGLIVHRSEVGAPGDFARLADQELDRLIAEQSQELRLELAPSEYAALPDQSEDEDEGEMPDEAAMPADGTEAEPTENE